MYRCAEKLLMGEGNVTTAGAADLQHVNSIAREMIYRCGFSKRLGPVSLMDNEEVYINKEQSRAVANIGSELAAIATTEVEEVCSLLVQQHFRALTCLCIDFCLGLGPTVSGCIYAKLCRCFGRWCGHAQWSFFI